MKEPSLYNSYSASLTADKIKPALVIRHRFDLAGEQIYACWRLRLVGMEDVKKTIAGDPASSFLPNATHLALALLEKVALPGDAVVFVTLQLVEGVTSSPLRLSDDGTLSTRSKSECCAELFADPANCDDPRLASA